MAAASSFPRYLSLSTWGNAGRWYMEYVHEDGASQGLFVGRGNRFLSPYSKLELVDAGNGRVHIRCCYNNKFLAILSEDDQRVSAVADEPVEDQSAWSCTMFELITTTASGGLPRIRVTHVHLGCRLSYQSPDFILEVGPPQTTGSMFHIHDISSFLALNLPRFAAFKADNGNYARLVTSGTPNVTCGTAGNSSNVNAMHEILPPADVHGNIRIRSLANNRCWRSHREHTALDETRDTIIVDTAVDELSLPPGHVWSDSLIRVERPLGNNNDHEIAFRAGVSTNNRIFYLRRIPANQLLAYRIGDTVVPPEAKFVVEEPVRSREIYNVRYNLGHARVLQGHPQSVSTQTMNNGSSVEQTMERTFTYSETTTTRWNTIVSVTYGVTASISARIPFLFRGSLSLSLEVSAAFEFGREHTTSVTKEDKVVISVPPRTRISVSRWETEGTHDVPFSYTQADILLNGQRVVSERDDGLAIGLNNYNIDYEVTEEPLAASTADQEARKYRIVPQTSRILLPRNDPSPPSLADDPAAAAE